MSGDPLADLAASPVPVRGFALCAVGRAYVELDEEKAKALRYLVEESGHSGVRISRATQDAGHHINHSTISSHRKGTCRCPR